MKHNLCELKINEESGKMQLFLDDMYVPGTRTITAKQNVGDNEIALITVEMIVYTKKPKDD